MKNHEARAKLFSCSVDFPVLVAVVAAVVAKAPCYVTAECYLMALYLLKIQIKIDLPTVWSPLWIQFQFSNSTNILPNCLVQSMSYTLVDGLFRASPRYSPL